MVISDEVWKDCRDPFLNSSMECDQAWETNVCMDVRAWLTVGLSIMNVGFRLLKFDLSLTVG